MCKKDKIIDKILEEIQECNLYLLGVTVGSTSDGQQRGEMKTSAVVQSEVSHTM